MTANDKYSFLNRDNLKQHIQMRLSRKGKTFSAFFFLLFLKCRWNFEHFQKKMILLVDVFSKLRSPRNVVQYLSKNSRLKRPFNKQHGKGHKTLSKSRLHHLYHIYWSLWRQLSRKKSVWVIWKFLRMFVNILTAVDKYSLLNRDNLRQPIQRQLSQKWKTFSEFVSKFLKSILIFEHFQKNDQSHSWCIS